MAEEKKPVEKEKTEIKKGKTEKTVEPKKVEKASKEAAIANGFSLRISPKYSFAICKVIRGKSPESAIIRLEEAVSGRRAIPMAGLEVGHKKGRGMSGGKFPKKACSEIITLIKQASANAVINGIENPIISVAMANQASAPYKSGGRKAKRTHVHLEVRDRTKLIKKKK